MDARSDAYDVAQQQHGALSSKAASEAGMTSSQLHRQRSSGQLVAVHRSVSRVHGAPVTWLQQLRTATLVGNELAVVSHLAACALLGFDGFATGRVEVTVPYGHSCRHRGVVWHRSRHLGAVDITSVLGIPVTTVSRTLIDIAPLIPASRLQELIDQCIRRGDTSPARLRWRTKELCGPGRAGSTILRELLNDYLPGELVPASVFERRALRVIEAAGLPRPKVRYKVKVTGGSIEVDLAWTDVRLCVECDGAKWHDTRQRFERDAERRTLLAAAGWRVIHIRWSDLLRRPQVVVAAIRAALAA